MDTNSLPDAVESGSRVSARRLLGSLRRTALAATTLAMALLIVLAAPAAAHEPGVVLPPHASTDCDGDIPIVVASDAAAQSDLYSAATLAGVIGTDCIVLAGPRDEQFPADQLQRLEDAESDGYLVGGEAAVPHEKMGDRSYVRVAGADRWETAAEVGKLAAELVAEQPAEESDSQQGSDAACISDNIAPGVYRVGNSSGQLCPGTYTLTCDDSSQYWERLSGFSGELDDIIANDFTTQMTVIVTIAPTDVGFRWNC